MGIAVRIQSTVIVKWSTNVYTLSGYVTSTVTRTEGVVIHGAKSTEFVISNSNVSAVVHVSAGVIEVVIAYVGLPQEGLLSEFDATRVRLSAGE